MSNASDFNLTKISTKDLSDNLRATIEFGGNAVIIGRRGVGKTLIIKDAIKESDCKELYWNLSTCERTDASGYPNFFSGKNDTYVSYLLPKQFEPLIEGREPVVCLFDEVDKADPALWASLLELVQFRSINGRLLPNLKATIMTGNLTSEGGQRPCLPLLDRAEKYLVEASHHHWLDWAAKSGQIHPSITAYIADHPDDLFGEADPGDVYADPSPRGWHNASKILNFGESKRWMPKILTNKVAGCIGKKSGIKYAAYFDHYQVLLPIIEKIMKGEDISGFNKLEQSKQLVTCMIACSRLARIIDEMKPGKKDLPKETDTVAKFLKNVDPEMSLISVRSQIGLERTVNSGLDDKPSWDEILREIARRINS